MRVYGIGGSGLQSEAKSYEAIFKKHPACFQAGCAASYPF
jgi:hypothetical protein